MGGRGGNVVWCQPLVVHERSPCSNRPRALRCVAYVYPEDHTTFIATSFRNRHICIYIYIYCIHIFFICRAPRPPSPFASFLLACDMVVVENMKNMVGHY